MSDFQSIINEDPIVKDKTQVKSVSGFPKTYPLKKEYEFGSDNLPIKLNIGTSLEIDLLPKKIKKEHDDDNLSVLTKDSYYASYGVDILSGLGVSATSEKIKASIDLESTFKSIYLTKQDDNTELGPSILKDMIAYKTFLKTSDLSKLEIDNILSVEWQGKLNTKASFTWAGVVTGSISSVMRSIKQTGVIDVDVKSGVEVGFDVTFSDHFTLAVKRTEQNEYHLIVQKKKNSNKSFSIDAGVGVSFSKPDEAKSVIQGLANQIIEKLTKKTEIEITDALDKFDNKVTGVKENEIVSLILNLLPESIQNKVDVSLKEKYQEYKKYINTKIEDGVKRNIKISFGYQYCKIKSSEVVLSCSMDLETLEKIHLELIHFNIKPVLDAILNQDKKIRLHSYLKLEEIKVNKTWGFSLTALGIKLIGNQDNTENIFKRISINNHQQITDQRIFTYKSKIGDWQHHWGIEIEAKMPKLSRDANVAKLSEFEYTLAFADISGGKISDQDKLGEHLDTTFLWQFYPDSKIEETIKKLFQDVKKRVLTVSNQVKFSPEAIHWLIQTLGTQSYEKNIGVLDKFSKAMAAALPYWSTYEERKYPSTREKIYAPFWKGHIMSNYSTNSVLNLKDHPKYNELNISPGLLIIEQEEGSNRCLTFMDIIKTYHIDSQSLDHIFKTFSLMRNYLLNGQIYDKKYASLVRQLSSIQSNSHYCRAFGRFLIDILPKNVQQNHVECITNISYNRKDGIEINKVFNH